MGCVSGLSLPNRATNSAPLLRSPSSAETPSVGKAMGATSEAASSTTTNSSLIRIDFLLVDFLLELFFGRRHGGLLNCHYLALTPLGTLLD